MEETDQPVAVPNVVTISKEENTGKCKLVTLDKILPSKNASRKSFPTIEDSSDSDEEVKFVIAERIRHPTPAENNLRKEMLEMLKATAPKSLTSNDPLIDEEDTDFPCLQCKKVFSSAKHLSEHVESHAKVKRRKRTPEEANLPYKCDYCPLIFEKQVSLAAHYRSHKDELMIKNQSQNEPKDLTCVECGDKFPSKRSLWNHRKMVHIEEIYKCKLCPKTFAKKVMYERHVENHTEREPIVCDICGKSFAIRHTLQIHMRSHSGEKPYLCADCGKSFAAKQRLQQHVRRHKRETKFSCAICGKQFYEKYELLKHSYRHTGEKPLSCDICGKGFILTNGLRVHRRTHTGEKPFVCDFDTGCNKCFSKLSQLKRHILGVHQGEKPHKCDICGKAFLDKGSLKTHIQRLHGTAKFQSGYECPIANCGMEFKTMKKLMLHQEQHQH